MILWLPAILAVVYLLTALWVWRAPSARTARSRGLASSLAGILVASVGLYRPAFGAAWAPSGLLAAAPLVTALVSALSIGLAPLVSHRRSTFARMSLLFACAQGFLATGHVYVLVVLWVASSIIAWTEVRNERGERGDRVFALYHLSSLGLLCCGALMISQQGEAGLAAIIVVLAGIGIREGVVPVQSWFARFCETAPMGLVVAYAAPQLGVYAHIHLLTRYESMREVAPVVAAVGGVTAVVGALLGVVQIRMRRAAAYIMISQTGLIAIGLESSSRVGLTGAVLNWFVLAVATSGFAMAVSMLEARRGPVTLLRAQGHFAQTPRLAVAFLVLGFASVGFPLTLGFVAEDLLVQGVVDEFPLLGLSLIVATAINGMTVLRAYFYLFTGGRHPSGEPDMNRRELALMAAAMVVLIGCGVMPYPLVAFEAPHVPGRNGSAKSMHVDDSAIVAPGGTTGLMARGD